MSGVSSYLPSVEDGFLPYYLLLVSSYPIPSPSAHTLSHLLCLTANPHDPPPPRSP